jgi:hypothetical protein
MQVMSYLAFLGQAFSLTRLYQKAYYSITKTKSASLSLLRRCTFSVVQAEVIFLRTSLLLQTPKTQLHTYFSLLSGIFSSLY